MRVISFDEILIWNENNDTMTMLCCLTTVVSLHIEEMDNKIMKNFRTNCFWYDMYKIKCISFAFWIMLIRFNQKNVIVFTSSNSTYMHPFWKFWRSKCRCRMMIIWKIVHKSFISNVSVIQQKYLMTRIFDAIWIIFFLFLCMFFYISQKLSFIQIYIIYILFEIDDW